MIDSQEQEIQAAASGIAEVSIFATPNDLRRIADLLEEKARTTDYGESLTAYTIKPRYDQGTYSRSFTVHFVCDQSRMNCRHPKYDRVTVTSSPSCTTGGNNG